MQNPIKNLSKTFISIFIQFDGCDLCDCFSDINHSFFLANVFIHTESQTCGKMNSIKCMPTIAYCLHQSRINISIHFTFIRNGKWRVQIFLFLSRARSFKKKNRFSELNSIHFTYLILLSRIIADRLENWNADRPKKKVFLTFFFRNLIQISLFDFLNY